MTSKEALQSLCDQLRGERLLVTSELDGLQTLNEQIQQGLSDLQKAAWISRQQQLTLSKLVRSDLDATPDNACRRTQDLERTVFLDSYHRLGPSESLVSDILVLLAEHPRQVARVVVSHSGRSDVDALCRSLYGALYGCCLFETDQRRFLRLMEQLMQLQLTPDADPRRLIRRGSCAFSRLYLMFTEGIFSAKIFLTAALHEPIMELLSRDELFLDIDPAKSPIRFPLEERQRRFGQEGTEKYRENLQKYRKVIENKLVAITKKFIDGIVAAMQFFPPPLAWLVRRLFSCLMKERIGTNSVGRDEAVLICIDLVFTNFICPAVTNPEPLGIIADTPIGYIARFNLMQVGQILQTLAVCQLETVDPKLVDLYQHFDQCCMLDVVKAIVENGDAGGGGAGSKEVSLDAVFPASHPSTFGGHPSEHSSLVRRPATLITAEQLAILLRAMSDCDLVSVTSDVQFASELRRRLERLPRNIMLTPLHTPNGGEQKATIAAVGNVKSGRILGSPFGAGSSSSRNHRSPVTPGGVTIVGGGGDGPGADQDPDVLPDHLHRGITPAVEVLVVPMPSQRPPLGLIGEEKFMESVRPTVTKTDSGNSGEKRTRFLDTESIGTSIDTNEVGSDKSNSLSSSLEGLMTNPDEEDVCRVNDDLAGVGAADEELGADTDGIVGGIAVSTTSSFGVPPSSANLSSVGGGGLGGRAISPSISGRESPLSQNRDDDDEGEEDGQRQPTGGKANRDAAAVLLDVGESGTATSGQRHLETGRGDGGTEGADEDVPSFRGGMTEAERKQMPPLPVTVQKQQENPEDLEEKFGKFGLPQPNLLRSGARDETISMVSDSWSTDVVASDTETGDTVSHVSLHPPGGIVPAGALPDVVPPPRLDLIRGEQAAGGLAAVAVLSSAQARALGGRGGSGVAGGSSSLLLACGEDRSDTWSVDAIASDSEVEPGGMSKAEQELDDDITVSDLAAVCADEILAEEQRERRRRNLDDGGAEEEEDEELEIEEEEEEIEEGDLLAASSTSPGFASSAPDIRLFDSPSAAVTGAIPVAQANKSQMVPSGGISLPVGGGGGRAPIKHSDTVGQHTAPLTKENLRRQSSGSSFYSRSDVDSEFSRDFPEEPPSSSAFAPPDFPSVSRGSLGEVSLKQQMTTVVGGGGSQSVEELPTNHLNTTPTQLQDDDGTSASERQSLGRLSLVLGSDAATEQQQKKTDSSGSSETSNQEDAARRAAVMRASGAIPKTVMTPVMPTPARRGQQTPTQHRSPMPPSGDPNRSGGRSGGGGSRSKKMTNLFQKVGDSLKGKKSLSPFRSNQRVPSPNNRPWKQADEDIAGGMVASRSAHELSYNRRDGTAVTPTDTRTADDIMKKYASPKPPPPPPAQMTARNSLPMATQGVPLIGSSVTRITVNNEDPSEPPYYDPENLTTCRAFLDAKRKLRLVLSSVNPSTFDQCGKMMLSSRGISTSRKSTSHQSSQLDLVQSLSFLLAENISGQNKSLTAHIREVLRCVAAFDSKGQRRLLRVLKEEHRKRTSYLMYLQQSKLTLLQERAKLDKLSSRIRREQSLSAECLVEVLVRLYLERDNNQRLLKHFVREFQNLVVQDEKTDFVDQFLSSTYQSMTVDSLWRHASDLQVSYAQKTLERSLMAQVYLSALYPNGDADVSRDKVLHETVKHLAQVVTPSHRALRIPTHLRAECPWPSAQAELAILNAYKSPRDKLACVVRCCEIIQNLLSLAVRAVSADDFTPVLVYVVIQSNPQGLLSNIQYVQGFYEARMEGSESYWWTQFTAAVEFIKQMCHQHL